MSIGHYGLSIADIQAASSPAGVQQLLARLGYDVSEPVEQTAASLGFAERVHHLIRQARRVAAKRLQLGLPPALEIYSLEVTNLTADLRKAVTTAFRNKPVNVLFILTTRDYDPLDFVHCSPPEHFVKRSLRLFKDSPQVGMILPKQITYAVTWGRLRDHVLSNGKLEGLVDVSEAFEEVLLEQVVVIVGRKDELTYEIPVYSYLSDGLLHVGGLDSRLCMHDIWPIYGVGPTGELLQKILENSTNVGAHFWIRNGLKNVRKFVGEHAGHPCLLGDNVGRYELMLPVLNIKRSALSRDVIDRLCKPKVLAQKIVAHLTNPLPYVRIAAMWDGTNSAIFETAIAVMPKCDENYEQASLALLGVLNSTFANWFMYEYVYNRSVRTMDFTEDYSSKIPLPKDWKGSIEELAQNANQATMLGAAKAVMQAEFIQRLSQSTGQERLEDWTGRTKLMNLDYLGWEDRWGRQNLNLESTGNGPDDIPWDLIARVYPSYPLPGIDAAAWEAAAWEELCDLLRKNKNKIGNSRIRADLTGRAALSHPTGPLRQLRDSFLETHRRIRANRARAAELDFLIDRIVFRLFELTLDEQKLILSRVGPGRPLPPRKRRKGREARAE